MRYVKGLSDSDDVNVSGNAYDCCLGLDYCSGVCASACYADNINSEFINSLIDEYSAVEILCFDKSGIGQSDGIGHFVVIVDYYCSDENGVEVPEDPDGDNHYCYVIYDPKMSTSGYINGNYRVISYELLTSTSQYLTVPNSNYSYRNKTIQYCTVLG